MNRLTLLLLSLVVYNCSNSVKDPLLLNGYWEIQEVELADGQTKTFTFSEVVDYFELTDSLSGYRKKLTPRIDGKFETNNTSEAISLKNNEGKWVIYYSTAYSNWQETIIFLDNDRLELLNEDGKRYFYKRYSIK